MNDLMHGSTTPRRPRGRLALAAIVALLCWPAAATAAPTATQTTLGSPALSTAGTSLGAAQSLATTASTPAPGFSDTPVITGLTNPTVVRFAPDGRIFVAEKSGLIKVFHSLTDTAPTIVADLRTQVDDYWDRGLLGFALDPNFPTNPYIYALYSFDAPIGGTAPTWNDACPTPPGGNTDGCVISGRLVRIQVSGDTMTGSPQTLINDWCQQFPSHSIGSLNFGAEGALYISGGDGASWLFADYGQAGGTSGSPPPTPKNPCGDPPAGVGGTEAPPTAEGGALRAQSLRRPSGEPVRLNGAILRVDPATGAALPDNPNASSTDANARRIVAYGLRNPFRFTIRPGTSDLWIGDVGWNTWEEINRRPSQTAPASNFGWPCYEGASPQSSYQSAGLNLCTSLYNAGTAVGPYYTYNHGTAVVNGDNCSTANGSSITALGFYNGSSYPAADNGALFFGDHTRNCIWAMPLGSNGLPDPTQLQTVVTGAGNPVDIESGPGGDLFYADLEGGAIHRITYGNTTQPPPPSGTSYLSDLNWTSMTNGWGPLEKDMSNGENQAGDGHTITLNGTTFAKGLGGHATSDVRYNLAGTCSRFRASVGVDDEAGGANGTIDFQVYADSTKVFDSGVMNGTSTTQNVDVPVSGAGQLRLVITDGGDGISYDHGDWANARIDCGSSTPPSGTSYLSDLNWTSMTNGWGPLEKDMSNGENQAGDGHTITLNGTTYTKGLGGHAASDVQYNLGGACTRFRADVGVDDEAGGANGTVDFQVYADSTKVFDSGVVNGASATQSIDVPLTGAGNLRLVITDGGDGINYDHGDWANARIDCGSGPSPPTPVIDSPASTLTWAVGDPIPFSGHATDPKDGTLPASALSWNLIIHHCPTTPDACHTHQIQTLNGVANGTVNAPDHGYPSWLELQLTATNSSNVSATTSVRLDPKTVNLNFGSSPSGLTLNVDASDSVAPFSRTVIVGSSNGISAPASQSLNGTTYAFGSWSDGGAATHNITAPATSTTYTASYNGPPPGSYYLSNLNWTSMTNGWGPLERDMSNGENQAGDGHTITLNGTTYAKGLGGHAASDVRYNLGGACSRFKADVGVDDEAGNNGTIDFQVYADATKVYDSGVMTGASATQGIDVGVGGASSLRLVITDGGDGINSDHGDWANARIECASAPAQPPANTTPPAISGTARRTFTLTTSNGSWSGTAPISFKYQWRRCDSTGANCSDIAGATGSSYTATRTDVGSRLRARVTATNSVGSAQADSAPTSAVTN